MGTKVSKYGKVRYIEPNSRYQNQLYGSGKTGLIPQYNIPHDMEDYSIYVDLTVLTPDRNGVYGNSTHIASGTLGGETRSFFASTDGFMTDAPGTTTYHDILSGNLNGNNENLGITNINISYNSYFYPEVVIKFTDVRGSALMMPNEENYRRKVINAWKKRNGEKEEVPTMVQSFFESIFNFPYPEFKLTVKGFYGKAIEYSLMVTDFKSSFNSSTGNFDATITLLGKMYGVYTDIPMSYLFLAPYCKYGGSNDQTIWQQKGFKIDGAPMPTFIELRHMLINANTLLKKDLNHDSAREYAEKSKQLSELEEIKTLYQDYFNIICDKVRDGNNGIIGDKWIENIILLRKTDETYSFSYLYPQNNNELKTMWQKLSEAINRYNANEYSTKLSFPNNQKPGYLINEKSSFNIKLTKTASNIEGELLYGQKMDSKYFTESPTDKNIDTIFGSKFKKLVNNIKVYCYNKQDGWSENFDMYFGLPFLESLNEQIKNTSEDLKEKRKAIDKEYTLVLQEMIGFLPSIRNIFKITMAHLDVFMEIYHILLTNIHSSDGRTLSGYGLSFERTDIQKLGNEKDAKLPPFPWIIKRNGADSDGGDTYEYPACANLLKIMEEEYLIDSMFDSTFTVLKKEDDNKTLLASVEDESLKFIPTLITDFITKVNPYSNVLTNDSTIEVDYIMFFLGLRMMLHFNYERTRNMDESEWGKLEGYNFWRYNKRISQGLLEKIKSTDFSSENFINFLSGIDTNYINGKPCYQINNNTNKLVEPKSGKLYATGKYHVPGAITTYNSFIESQSNKASYIISGKSDTYTYNYIPINYIKLLDDYSFITNWKEKINSTDLSELCNDDTKQTLIETQLSPLKGIYDDTYAYREYQPKYEMFEDSALIRKYYYYIGSVLYRSNRTLNDNFKATKYNTKKHSKDDIVNSIQEAFRLNNKLVTINTSHGEDFTNYPYIDCIQYTAEKDLYGTRDELHNDISFFAKFSGEEGDSVHFLRCFPYNFEALHKVIANGRRLIRLPYIYQLFLGCVFKKVKELLDSKKRRPQGRLIKVEDMPELLGGLNAINMRALNQIIAYFLPVYGNNAYFHPIEIPYVDTAYSYPEWVTDGRYFVDFLNLITKYDKWCSGNGEYDFQTICKNFKLVTPGVPVKPSILKLILKIADIAHSGLINGQRTCTELGLRNISVYYPTVSDISVLTSLEETINNFKPKNVGEIFDLFFEDFTKKYSAVSVGDNGVILHFNDGAPGYESLNNFVKKDSLLSLPYYIGGGLTSGDISNTDDYGDGRNKYVVDGIYGAEMSKFQAAFNGFKSALLYYYDKKEEKKTIDFNQFKSDNVSNTNKLAMYKTLKNLYDKHLCTLHHTSEISKYRLPIDENEKIVSDDDEVVNNDTEFDRFHFIDSFYTDIGDLLFMNGEKLSNLIGSVVGYEESGDGSGIISSEMSLYSFMAKICEYNNMLFIAMPVFNGAFTGPDGEENFDTMFTPLPFSESIALKPMSGPSYVCLYPHEPSYHLDMPNSRYANDGFSISSDPFMTGEDVAGTTQSSASSLFNETGKYIVPAFGVEYGIQNQGIFKSVNVNMDNPQITEQVVASTFNVANMKSQEDPRKHNYIGQDLFKIYSNHSYTCTVEMMGCAQIQPLMYFELSNIPMFKGAYMIIKVEHDITPGNMTTKFTGVRINKNKIPMVVEIINLNSIIDNISDDGSIGGGSKIDMDTNNNLSNSLFATLDTEDSIVLAPESNYDYDSFISKYPDVKFDFITTNPNGATGAFNESNPHLRRLLYSLGKRLDKRMESFTITSMARTNATYKDISGSDHAVGAKVNKHRKKIKGKDINDNEQTYDNMGCAVDIIGLNASGSKDKRNTSIALFDLLALEYTNNIRQLLWEVKEGFSTSDNCISNCIHLSTYGGSGKTEDGKGSLNDKHEIGVQIYDKSSKKWTYLTANNRKDKSKAPTNLPPMFIKTLHRLYLANKADKLYVPNFNYALTGEMLEKWCNELNV